MADTVTREQRSQIMRAVKSKNTSPELLVRKAAHRLGLRFRLHDAELPGRPDLVLPRRRTVIFVNGCFWHRHHRCKKTTTPKSNETFWLEKFHRNKARDSKNYKLLRRLGWDILVIWQCETATNQYLDKLTKHFFKR